MNHITKRVLICCSILFSIAALVLVVMLFKNQASLRQQLEQLQGTSILVQKKLLGNTTSAQGMEKNGGSWLNVQKQVKDTVVQVFSHVTEFNWIEPYKTPDQSDSAGSGFFINTDGNIITNYHVVAQASSVEIQIPSFGLERFDASIVGVSPERDIALIALTPEACKKIRAKIGKIPFLTLGDSDSILRSQEVLAIGYPLGQSRLKSTLGIVSGRERLGNSGFIQITAPINPGNSGGPALNTAGEVVGINSCGVPGAQNVGYIIPINEVTSALKDLHKVKLLRKPTLGCLFTAATPNMVAYLGNPTEGGWYIAKVFKGTLLESVGIKGGDMLCEINGHPVDMFGELDVPWSEDKASIFEFLNRITVGDTLNFVVYRSGERKAFSFKFEPRYLPPIRMIYPEFEKESIDYEVIGGMVVMPLTLNHVSIMMQRIPDLVRYGKIEQQHEPALIITHIFPNSQAYKARVPLIGEILEEVNGEKVKTLADFRKAILKSKTSRYITLRTDDFFYAVMPVDAIIQEEDTLAKRYFFKKSPLIAALSNQSTPVRQSPKHSADVVAAVTTTTKK